jgi:hypothetical protein
MTFCSDHGQPINSIVSARLVLLGRCRLARKGRLHERNQYHLRSSDRVVNGFAAHVDAQGETANHRVSITENVPLLRIDHISTESSLPGVRRNQHLKAAVTAVATNRLMSCPVPGRFPQKDKKI